MRRSRLQNILTKDILEYEYKQLGSMEKMAAKLDVSIDSVYKYMKLYGITYNRYYNGLYDCDEDVFKEESERAFYLAGFIAADGSLQDRSPSTKVLKITLSTKDADHLYDIRKVLNSNHPISQYLVKPTKLVKTTNYCVEIQIVSKSMFADFAKFNIVPNKTFIYTFPGWMADHPLRHHYMRGYFDGDGCASLCGLGDGRTIKQRSFGIVGTESFVSDYRSVLSKDCNLSLCKVSRQKGGRIWKTTYSGNTIIRRIHEFLYHNATIFLERKLAILR